MKQQVLYVKLTGCYAHLLIDRVTFISKIKIFVKYSFNKVENKFILSHKLKVLVFSHNFAP